MKVAEVLRDLLDEQTSLDAVVASLDDSQWDLPTASPGWSVSDQIGHLAYFDDAASAAIRDPKKFKKLAEPLKSALQSDATSGDDFTLGKSPLDELTLKEFREMNPVKRLARWRHCRSVLAEAAATLDERDRVIWYGPSMGAKSFLTARLMEAWAHGSDVRQAVGVPLAESLRLRHVAQLGYITRGWSYLNRGLTPPDGDVVVELAAPDGEIWHWGDATVAADNKVTGTALDFCLVVTQRRHIADTELVITGEHAREWMSIAQAFAGPPSDGPVSGTGS